MHLTIPGIPQAKQRPRMTKTGHTYTPKQTRDYEALIKKCWKEQSGETLEDGPLKAYITAYLPIPKNTKKAVHEKMRTGEIRPTKKPDLDNIIMVLDALNGLAFPDDKNIVEITAEKYYSTETRLEIRIEHK